MSLLGQERPPGNSLAHVRCAAELGFEAIELDIRISGDGVPVLVHDAHLPDGQRVSGLTFAELRRIMVGEWRGQPQRVASLEEVLALEARPRIIVADMRVHADHAGQVAAVVRRHMNPRDFVFTAYDVPRAQAFRRALPAAKVFLKTYDGAPHPYWVDEAVDVGLTGIMFQVRDSRVAPLEEIVAAARYHGLRTMTFLHAAGPGRLQVLLDAGIDHVLTTKFDGRRGRCGGP